MKRLLWGLVALSPRILSRSLAPGSINATLYDEAAIQPGPQPRLGWEIDYIPPADDGLWCKAVAKGTTLVKAMSYDDSDAGALFQPPMGSATSHWSVDHLPLWSWTLERESRRDWCNWEADGYFGIANFFRALGISYRCIQYGGNWAISEVLHGDRFSETKFEDQTYRGPDGRTRRFTGAEFYMGVSGIDGGVITLGRHGCADQASKLNPPVPPDQYPAMKQSSDLLWALWENDVRIEKQSNINFFLSVSIENDDTLQIIKRALDQIGTKLTRAGTIFDMSSEEGKAILGSPNAVAFAYFLIQHKAVLGTKMISEVHVIQGETEHKSPCLFFRVSRFSEWKKPPQTGGMMARAANNVSRSFALEQDLVREHTFSFKSKISVA
ncbi:hypothetical protein ACN47E_002661 [Coniothyrium glycines]